jgi:hypothetical protein
MSLLLFGAAVAGLGLGLADAVGKSKAREAEYQDKLNELERTKALLDTQFSQAKQSYNLATDQAREQTAEANKELRLLSSETLDNRDMALDQTARAGSMQSEINAMQMATLAVENQQQLGEATQRVATSGFRGTGTALSLVENVKEAGSFSTQQARMQSMMSNYRTYASAVSNYTSATQQADAYMRKIRQNKNQLNRELEKLELQMNQTTETYMQKGGYLAEDIEYMKDEGYKALQWGMFTDSVSSVVGGLVGGITMFA